MLVLVGLLGMHGLATAAPLGMPAMGSSAPAMAQEAGSADHLCHHHSTGGHADHAAADCAATGVSTFSPPPAPSSRPCTPGFFETRTAAANSVERAPPDLARLQLLRI